MILPSIARSGNPSASPHTYLTGGTTRPQRYRRDKDISTVVDLLQTIEDRLRESGDITGAERVAVARNRAADLALGVKGGAR